jgi:hypothetical protein
VVIGTLLARQEDIDITLLPWHGNPGPTPAPPPAACAGPRGTIGGLVKDMDGHAVAGAQVQVVGLHAYQQVETGTDGRYAFGQLCSGSYQLVAYVDDPAKAQVGVYDADGDGTPDDVNLTDAVPGATGIDITLRSYDPVPEPQLPTCANAQGSVEGVVTDKAGHAVADAEVAIFTDTGAYTTVRSDDQGHYRTAQLCSGGYMAVGYKWIGQNDVQLGVYDIDGDGQPDTIQLTDAQPAARGIDITLQPEQMPPLQSAVLARALTPATIVGNTLARGTGLAEQSGRVLAGTAARAGARMHVRAGSNPRTAPAAQHRESRISDKLPADAIDGRPRPGGRG